MGPRNGIEPDQHVIDAIAAAGIIASITVGIWPGVPTPPFITPAFREQALAHMPTLRADRLVAGFLYWDARSDDSRLTLTVLRTVTYVLTSLARSFIACTNRSTGSPVPPSLASRAAPT